jgi:hypothetical protein
MGVSTVFCGVNYNYRLAGRGMIVELKLMWLQRV